MNNPFDARDEFETGRGPAGIYRLSRLEDAGLTKVADLPFSIRVLLESVLRNCDGELVTEQDVVNLAGFNAENVAAVEVPLKPARVLLQDFTGVPAVVDLAAMRRRRGSNSAAMRTSINPSFARRAGHRPFGSDRQVSAHAERAGPEQPRHRVQTQQGTLFEFLRWGQQTRSKIFRVVPPSIPASCHQVNLEYLGQVCRIPM